MSETFRIVLTDYKNHDTYKTREFDLPINSTFPIGRASKNATKRELMPAPHNAYIDSPVISREHAVLSANTSSGTPQVYIRDSGSMHGTTINERKLEPNTTVRLSHGDLLQFGVDVNRNDEFFVARQYTFESHLSRPFSLGFTVPDVDSDEEEVDVRERCGSQQNPLVLDSDSDEDEDVTMAERLLSEKEEPAEDVSEYQEYPESATRSAFVEETYSDQDGSVAYSSDGDLLSQSIDVDIDSDAASIVSSAMEYPSEPEVPDSEDEDGFDLYNDRDISDSKSTATASVQPLEQSLYTNTQTVQSRNAFSLDHEVFELPHPDTFNQTFGSSFTDAIAPPLPPRRSPSRAPWNNTNFTAFGQQLDSPGWSDEMPAQACYMAPTFGDRSSVFGAQPPPMQESIGSQSNSLLFGQTPPPMPALDVTTPPPQPARRTKVTIEEIVEDQPPTPESVNNLKRKANVLSEEPQSPVAEEAITFTLAPAVIPCEAEEAAVQTIAAVPETIVIAQRPKKQPKSILSRLGDTARVSLFGAAGAFVAITALSTLPDTFFT